MVVASNQELQFKENQIMALISSVGEEDPELAESLKQTLSIIKRSHRYQMSLTSVLDKTN